MKYFYFLFFSTICILGCEEKSQLEKDVMAIHDEVMPKMGKLNKIKRELKKQLPHIANDSIKGIVIEEIKKLESVDEGMMSWMAEWDVPDDDAQKSVYLEKEMARVKKVKKDILSSMDSGQSLISELNKNR